MQIIIVCYSMQNECHLFIIRDVDFVSEFRQLVLMVLYYYSFTGWKRSEWNSSLFSFVSFCVTLNTVDNRQRTLPLNTNLCFVFKQSNDKNKNIKFIDDDRLSLSCLWVPVVSFIVFFSIPNFQSSLFPFVSLSPFFFLLLFLLIFASLFFCLYLSINVTFSIRLLIGLVVCFASLCIMNRIAISFDMVVCLWVCMFLNI